MSQHYESAKQIQELRFWVLIEILMICISILVPAFYLLFRHCLFTDALLMNTSDRGLDDDTEIGKEKHTWRKKKSEVLPEDYKEFKNKQWYLDLTEDDKDLVDQLRRKQQDEGDMKPLKSTPMRIIDSTEDYVSSTLPTMLLPQFTAIIGPFLANLYLHYLWDWTDVEKEEDKGYYYTSTDSRKMLE